MTIALARALFSIEKISYLYPRPRKETTFSLLFTVCQQYQFWFSRWLLGFLERMFQYARDQKVYGKTQLKKNLFGWTGWLKDFGMTLKWFVCVCVCGCVISCCLFSLSLRENGRNNSQHCWPNNVGSRCVCFHVDYRLTGFKLCATTYNRVCKRTQHVTSNNVGCCWPTIKTDTFGPSLSVRLREMSVLYRVK